MNKNLSIENARLIFKNFTGEASKYNRAGNRHFSVVIPNDMVEDLLADGWNVKSLMPREEGDEPLYFLEVTIGYNIPPRIYLITSTNKTLLNEDTIDSLQFVDIINVDIIIRPYNWEVNGKHGVKAYVKTMYVTIDEDEFAHKYED